MPHLLYGEPFVANWNRAALRTAVIVVIWFWVHVETKRLLRRLHQLDDHLVVCPWCKKIGDQDEWVSMESYFGSKFSTRTTHGMCPECPVRMLNEAGAKQDAGVL